MVKMDEIGRLTFIDRLGIPKWSKISQFPFQMFHLRWSGYNAWKIWCTSVL